ncbi:unnamed protein product [Staurois parvus]|uniref:Uncharacterized protein n=1 Tax=Staurois parvus TaxID=386267 RepID=A0ABN9HJU7_9NEOB|nr:unnamed protein product [Staurois parvus]
MHIHTHTETCTHTHRDTCTHTPIQTHVYTHTQTCTDTHMYIHTQTHVHTHTQTHVHTHIHVHKHTHPYKSCRTSLFTHRAGYCTLGGGREHSTHSFLCFHCAQLLSSLTAPSANDRSGLRSELLSKTALGDTLAPTIISSHH